MLHQPSNRQHRHPLTVNAMMARTEQARNAARKGYGQQLTALIRKNFMLTVTRKPLGFLLLCYGIPLAMLALLLSIPSFLNPQQRFGVASPAPIKTLADAIDGKLVIVKPDGLGADVDRVITTLTQPLDKSSVVFLRTELELLNTCLANSRGHSNCFASVAFIDSPETRTTSFKSATGSNHTWQYTIRVDPATQDTSFDIFGHSTDSERTYLPLQLALNNAITGRNDRPQVIGFTSLERQRQEQAARMFSLGLMAQYYAFILSACFYMIVYRYVTLITTERDSGMAQLIDSMGGPWAPATRVFSWLITINAATLPCYVAMGVLYWQIIFPTSAVGLLIGWQVLQGLAINSSVTFAAAFFTKARVSAIYVIGALLLLSVAAQAFSFQWAPPPSPAGGHALSLLFTTANGLLFTQQMILWELAGSAANPYVMPLESGYLNTTYNVTLANLLGYLALQIVVFPLLAICVERLMHGISYKRRTFHPDMDQANDHNNNLVVQTTGLKKKYNPGVFKKRPVVAADGVSIDGHRSQILCLAGPNGSGKTTTLHMIAGFIEPTDGGVSIGAQPSQIGICPQRNTLWPELTVEEHVRIWSKVKGGVESEAQLRELIASCDLTKKAGSKAKTLSGGQKRKLQLACMFVGDSTVCLIDECTSGLDPLSRRIIWEILLDQRAKRSIVFTTHFLDEVDVLADHMVILSKGQVKCQGPVAELKTRYGNGYSVLVPNSASLDTPYPCEIHQDRLVYRVPDSVAAAELASQFAAAGTSDVSISGPQVEDVFLNVAEDVALESSTRDDAPVALGESFKMSQGRVTSFWSQFGTLYRKRWTILWRFWWPYFYVVALPLIIIPCMSDLLRTFRPDFCTDLEPRLSAPTLLQYDRAATQCMGSFCPRIYVGDAGAAQDLARIYDSGFYQVKQLTESAFRDTVNRTATVGEWTERLRTAGNFDRGGFFYTSDTDPGYIAYKPNLGGYYRQFIDSMSNGYYYDEGPQVADPAPVRQSYAEIASSTSLEVMSLFNQMRSGQQIITSFGGFAKEASPRLNTGIFYVIFFCLVMAIYPAAFVLYPAIEKSRMVRSVQYANGVRRLPMWFAYGAFDSMFVVVISIVLSIVMSFQIVWIGTTWIMLPILILYGLAALLQMYIIAHFVTGPLKSFLTAFGINLLMLGIAAIIFGVGYSGDTFLASSSTSLGIVFGLFLVVPVGNVFRAMVIGFNIAQSRCNKAELVPIGSIYAYGGPILLLVVQVVALLGILVWVEGDLALFRRRSAVVMPDAEKSAGSAGPPDVEAERRRVEGNDTDLLRLLHLSKSFGSNKAVDDVTLGLPQSEVLALLGPNGAGKSTLVNLIQSDITADEGQAFLCGDDSRTRIAQTHFGVCPQYDVMDMLNTRQQLVFYARVKGIDNIDQNVDYIMAKLGLTPHATTSTTKLSGGNKRKLSLAVALIGTPPVLVLDEPTSAMDAVAKRNFWRVIQKISPDHSILLTTHSMEEADALATRAAILSKRLLAVGTSQALRQQYSNHYYISLILRSAPYSSDEEMGRVRDFVQANIAGAQMERRMLGGQVRFTIPGKKEAAAAAQESHVASVIELLERHKEQLGVDCYSVAAATLENVFLNVVRANNVLEEENTAYINRKWYKRIGSLF